MKQIVLIFGFLYLFQASVEPFSNTTNPLNKNVNTVESSSIGSSTIRPVTTKPKGLFFFFLNSWKNKIEIKIVRWNKFLTFLITKIFQNTFVGNTSSTVKFLKQPENITLAQDKRLLLRCKPNLTLRGQNQNATQIQYKWFKDGKQITYNSKIVICILNLKQK